MFREGVEPWILVAWELDKAVEYLRHTHTIVGVAVDIFLILPVVTTLQTVEGDAPNRQLLQRLLTTQPMQAGGNHHTATSSE